MPRELKAQIGFSLPIEICSQMDDECAVLRESRSEFLREAVRLRLDLIWRDREAKNA